TFCGVRETRGVAISAMIFNSMNTRTFLILAATCLLSVSVADRLTAQTQPGAHALTLLDRNGHVVPDSAPAAVKQIFDVTVAPMGRLTFAPSSVNISVGDTVRWTWAGNAHSVTSGQPCMVDSQFCSPNDMNCPAETLSNVGTVYMHTFSQPGTYTY